jgi:hypothetical protein
LDGDVGIEFIIGGDGPKRIILEETIEKFGLQSQVQVTESRRKFSAESGFPRKRWKFGSREVPRTVCFPRKRNYDLFESCKVGSSIRVEFINLHLGHNLEKN